MDKDYIREGIELADGWSRGAGNLVWNGQHPFELNGPMREMVLDSVAAQLARQVDAVDRYILDDDRGYTDVLDDYCRGSLIAQATGPSRTENTIKAIIDSGVLK